MITLYGMTDSGNCYKPRLLLAKLGRNFRHVEVNSLDGETRQPAYLALNRNGKVPLLELRMGVASPNPTPSSCIWPRAPASSLRPLRARSGLSVAVLRAIQPRALRRRSPGNSEVSAAGERSDTRKAGRHLVRRQEGLGGDGTSTGGGALFHRRFALHRRHRTLRLYARRRCLRFHAGKGDPGVARPREGRSRPCADRLAPAGLTRRAFGDPASPGSPYGQDPHHLEPHAPTAASPGGSCAHDPHPLMYGHAPTCISSKCITWPPHGHVGTSLRPIELPASPGASCGHDRRQLASAGTGPPPACRHLRPCSARKPSDRSPVRMLRRSNDRQT